MRVEVVGLIPARGGSKAIPRKNLHLLAGKPLLAYTAEAARTSRTLTRRILSTDDAEIADMGRRLGLEVPFERPAPLSADDAPMGPVLRHALDWYVDETGAEPEALVLLQPTSPLRAAHHIDEAVKLLRARAADTVVSVVRVPHRYHPGSILRELDGRVRPYFDGPTAARRQDKDPLWARNGPAVLVVRPAVLRRDELYGERTVPYPMSEADSVDIDEPADLELAERLLLTRTRTA